MDAIVNKAVEELCIQSFKGGNSIPITDLWPKLKPYLSENGVVLCNNVKKAILSSLINIPGLEFETKDNDLVKCTAEECERMELKIVVPEHMLDNFTRIHEVEVSKSKLCKQELEALHLRKRVLQRIAIARANGITQCELTKEFGIKANNFFHIFKELEVLGLIVRHEAVVWTNKASNKGKLISKHTTTNMLYLSRYRKHLHSQQRLEIRGGVLMSDDLSHENSASCDVKSNGEDVHIKDYLPILREICNKLEKAKGKVIAISNIKKDLGYRDALGHKEWRKNILRRLTQAQVVEVTEKGKSLRLLKEFSTMHFNTRVRRSDNLGRKQPPVKIEKRGQIGQQLVELPVEHQTFEEVQDWGNNRMSNGQNFPIDVGNTVNDTKMQIMDSSVRDLVPVKSSVTETISPRCQAYKAYSSHKLREDWAREQREQWILKMLELIRLVCGEHTVDATHVIQITLTHALELKPYFEEPFSSTARSSDFHGPDSCHQVRHDFVLSNRNAVDEYWNTLEYLLAGANPEAASIASPESANQEVFHCFHNRKQMRLCRFQGVVTAKWMEVRSIKGRNNYLQKRKRSSGGDPARHVKLRTSDVRPSDKSTFDTVDPFPDEQNAFLVSPGDVGCNSQINCVGDHREVTKGIDQCEKTEANHSFMKRSDISSLKPTCRASFSWSEDADRQLVIEFVRHKAVLGPYSRFKWASVKNLPASPDACKRRMTALNSCMQFRSALMNLCNEVLERYARHLQNRSLDCGDCEEMVWHHASEEEDLDQGVSDGREHSRKAVAHERWDDCDNDNVKVALDKVLECKNMAKLDGSNGVQSANDNSDLSLNAERPMKQISYQEKSSHWVPKRCGDPLSVSNSVSRQAFESVSVANAAELLKMAVLAFSRFRLVPASIVETYNHYPKHDILDAFNFLKEKKVIRTAAKGTVVFPPNILNSMFLSLLQRETGAQAARFSTWLHQREKEMINGGVVLPPDMQCGDVLTLCGLLSSGELSIIPCLPDEGIGEAKDARTFKRKHNICEFWDGNRSKKLRPWLIGEGEGRRAKGFPDITLSLSRATFLSREAVELFKDDDYQPLTQIGEDNQVKFMSVLEASSSASHIEGQNHVKETHENENYRYTAVSSKELLWEAMASCAEQFCSFSSKKESSALNPGLYRSLLLAVQKAGDQGLSMKEISMSVDVQGEKMLGVIIDVLETFGQVLKVNAYDSVHVVDSLYRSKYVLSTVSVARQDSLVIPAGVSKGAAPSKYEAAELHNPTDQKQPSEPLLERQSTNGHDSLDFQTAKSHFCKPILFWIDGDGTVNNIVYRKLVSRALGIIMQNPGILEDNVIDQMHGLNPQSCRTLLEMMILDNHIIAQKMFETKAGPPAILSGLLGRQFMNSKIILKRHLFANPTSTSLL
ncbi:uncharacterized protein LOC107813492 isoform X7 [Nicotiana tabacum]|uniref:Uncharacterized protein LOC107813492 isoform X7 n=1 Tax=Nicotiana tabacum TaxID=4097 RepID=A0AC58S003_TOBAC